MMKQDDERLSGMFAASQPDDRSPVPHTAARRLQDMIRSGELPPASRLPSQRELARQLGLSRASLREALNMLETLGMVRTYPARGTFVSDDARDASSSLGRWRFQGVHAIADVFQSRILIEGELARLAAMQIGQEAIDALIRANEDFERFWHEGDLVSHVDADLAFHNRIAEACPNLMLREIYLSLREMLAETQRQPVPVTAPARMAESIAEHRTIISALSGSDPSAARTAIQRHIANTAKAAGLSVA